MHKSSTQSFPYEQLANQLLFLFEVMPEDEIKSSGIEPSSACIIKIKQRIRCESTNQSLDLIN